MESLSHFADEVYVSSIFQSTGRLEKKRERQKYQLKYQLKVFRADRSV